MGERLNANSELFIIPREENSFILYSPLNRKVGEINSAGVNTINKFLNDNEISDIDNRFISDLYKNGFLHKDALKKPVFPDNYSFMPHEVTLFATSRCNLHCRYCYAEAGKKNIDMPFEIAKSAIDLVAKNAGLLGLPKFAVGFHGGGEPTLAWDLVTSAVSYAHEISSKKGIDVEIFAATNGLFNEKQRDFIVNNFNNLNISMDGPADIQNYNRPTVNGNGSYELIYQNLKFFDKEGFNYGIRATITEKTVERLVEIVEWFKSEFNLSFLHLEPVWLCGRCQTTGEKPPNDNDFITHFLKAADKANQTGINLIYSGLRLDSLLSKFCAASGDGFNVLPEGTVTSCYEVTESDDRKAELFHYGKYDFQQNIFIFDNDKIKRLQKFSVENIDYCSDCFCKWHCAGDCISKVFDYSGTFEHKGSTRCELNRQLTSQKLNELLIIKK